MKKVGYLFGVLVLVNCALFTINKWQEWQSKNAAVLTASQSAVSAPVRAEQKTYRVSFKVSPVVQSTPKNQ